MACTVFMLQLQHILTIGIILLAKSTLEYSAKLDHKHIWQAFVQESVRSIAADQDVYLELNENLPIDEVTKEAFNALGQNGVI